VRDVGQVDARQRIRNALRPLGERKPHQLGGVAQVFNGGEMIVEADRIRQIADATLGLKRLTRRIEAEHVDLARPTRCRSQPEHHQNGGG